MVIIEGSLEVKLPTIWRDEKAVSREKSQKREDQKKEDAGARKGRKVAKHCVFRGFVAPEGWKVGSLKRRVRRHLGRWEMKSCTPLWREANFEVKRYKTPQRRTLWKLRYRKSARRCGAKHISKSKYTKHHMFAPLLEVRMLKKCTPLWREAHFQVKMYKTHHVRTFWRFRCAMDCGPCQEWANVRVL